MGSIEHKSKPLTGMRAILAMMAGICQCLERIEQQLGEIARGQTSSHVPGRLPVDDNRSQDQISLFDVSRQVADQIPELKFGVVKGFGMAAAVDSDENKPPKEQE